MNYQAALAHLSQDKHLFPIIQELGLPELELHGDAYSYLVRSIIAQQISAAAAKSIRARFEELLDFDIQPSRILDHDIDSLRTAGLSKSKAQYILNVAAAFHEQKWTDTELNKLSNEEVITKLSSIKGVGEWTAQMVLMFSMGREDIWPIGDLVVRNYYKYIYQLPTEMPLKEVKAHMSTFADQWSPYRSYAALLMWHMKRNGYKP